MDSNQRESQSERQDIRYSVVMVTAPSREEAETIANALIAARLAACVSLVPVYSIYTWQGEIHHNEEWQLFVKSDLAQFDALSKKIQSLHSYEVPEIIALPIVAGFPPYLQWISEQVQSSHPH